MTTWVRPKVSQKSEPKSDRPSLYTALATIVGVVIALFAWLFPRPWRSPKPATAETPIQQQAQTPTVVSDLGVYGDSVSATNGAVADIPPSSSRPSSAGDPPTIVEPPPPKPKPEPYSTTFTLAEGRQKVLAHGDLSVSGEFNQVGQEVVPTLHLQARGREPEDFPLLAAGGRFEIAVGGRTYVVAVLSADSATRQFEIEVDLVR